MTNITLCCCLLHTHKKEKEKEKKRVAAGFTESLPLY
jgi:hypothetical protein